MFAVSFAGNAIATAEPLLSSLNSSRTRPPSTRVAVQVRDDDRTGIELHGADPPRRALAKIGSVEVCTVVSASSVPPLSTSRNGSRGDRHDGQASRGG